MWAPIIASGIDVLTAAIVGGAEGVRAALGQLATTIVSQLIPGPVGGAIGRLVGVLINKLGTKGDDLKVRVQNVVRTFPANLSMPLAANPASGLYGARALSTGAGFTVNVAYRDGSEDLVNVKIGSALAAENLNDGWAG